MKNKIIYLIIGILIGAIITTAGFLIYNKTISKNSNTPEMMQRDKNGQMGEPPSGDMKERPEKPSEVDGEEPPEKPNESTSSSNS